MLVFDAPNRETCTVERSRSNTPLQALVLMNDPQFIEAARVLARLPNELERSAIGDLLADLRRSYEEDPRAAAALLRVGEQPVDESVPAAELAAWSVAASAVLNLDEAVTRL